MNLDFYNDIPNVNVTPEMRNKYYTHKNDKRVLNDEDYDIVVPNDIKVIKNNCEKERTKEIKTNDSIKICCSECGSELEITENNTHIGWLGARFIICPCCGKEAMVDELDRITLTKDNLKFPVHFSRTTKGLGQVVEVNSAEIVKEIKRAIAYFRENKGEHYWHTSYGDLFLIVLRYPGDEEYFIMATKDFYETHIPFEKEDYE